MLWTPNHSCEMHGVAISFWCSVFPPALGMYSARGPWGFRDEWSVIRTACVDGSGTMRRRPFFLGVLPASLTWKRVFPAKAFYMYRKNVDWYMNWWMDGISKSSSAGQIVEIPPSLRSEAWKIIRAKGLRKGCLTPSFLSVVVMIDTDLQRAFLPSNPKTYGMRFHFSDYKITYDRMRILSGLVMSFFSYPWSFEPSHTRTSRG